MLGQEKKRKYYELEHEIKDLRHQKVVALVNKLMQGLRDVIRGEELLRIATSAVVGLLSVSDVNPAFSHKIRRYNGDNFIEIDEKMPAIKVAGNIILTGPPGAGKTFLARTLASFCGLSFAKVPFTPDLTPRDLVATTVLEGDKTFTYLGPVFSHFLLADEINRATPKTQSALLERMSSGSVTYKEQGREVTRALPQPCFTIATRNPIEQEGTYSLPEAQLDRFLFNIDFKLPSAQTIDELLAHIDRIAELTMESLTSEEELLAVSDFIFSQVEVPEKINKYIRRLIMACYDPFVFKDIFPDLKKRLGGESLFSLPPNSRAAIHLRGVAKTLACISGNLVVGHDHVKKRFYEVVNHRFLLNKGVSMLINEYGGVDKFIQLLVKGDPRKNIKGLLDVVSVDGD